MTALKLLCITLYLKLLYWFRVLVSRSETTYKILFTPGYEAFRFRVGNWRAWRVYELARRRVPAYKKFLEQAGNPRIRTNGFIVDFSALPITDKESYVKKYSIEDRCLDGVIPAKGVMVDESSGTSGTANNWLRGSEERGAVKFALQTAIHFLSAASKSFS